MKVVRMVQTTYTAKMDVERMRELRKKAESYRKASEFDVARDFSCAVGAG